jgi:pantothenate kinase
MANVRELILTVPVELAERFSGLAIDMGGTLMKFVYRRKDETETVSGKSTSSVLRLVSFRSQLDVALDYVRQWADLRRNSEDGTVTIRATGLSSDTFRDAITNALDVKVEYLMETDCVVCAFTYLAHRLPRSELLEPFQKDAITEPMQDILSINAGYKSMVEAKVTKATSASNASLNEVVRCLLEKSSRVAENAASDVALTEAEPDVFPCLFVVVGSTTSVQRIEKDGTFQLVDCSMHSGKSYFGIGKMLTGCQTFDDLIDMASKGNKRNVHQYTTAFSKTDEGSWNSAADAATADNFYAEVKQPTPSLMYGFGEAADSDPGKLKPEDVAHAWLSHAASEIARSVQLACHLRRIKRVFFAGGFCSRPFVRHVITAEFAYRLLQQLACDEVGDYIDFDFVKAGECIGALGCAVADLQLEP